MLTYCPLVEDFVDIGGVAGVSALGASGGLCM